MAKGKKAGKGLTPEEKLEQALVPVEKQPYSVPENWCWVYTPVLFDIEYGKGLPTKQLTEEGYPVFGANGQIGYYDQYMFVESKALMSCRGAYSGVMNKSLPYSFVTSNSLVMNCHKINMTSDYIYYLFSALDTGKLVTGTAQPQVTVQAFSEYPIPLIPLAEQQRIVDRIESIFAKLDEAKEKAQTVVDGFELRKSAILHKAFTGELTEQWRKEHGEGMESWKNIPLRKCLLPMETRKPTGRYFRYIDIDAIDNQRQKVREPKIIETIKSPSRASRAVETGNVLFSMVRPYLKNIALIDEEMSDCIASTGFYVCRCKSNILPKFLYELLCSKEALDYLMQFMKGDNSPSIRKDDLLDMEIKLPSIAEQKALCEIVGRILSKEQQAKEVAEAVIEQIDMVKKAVLVRAFRGELGTNDLTEESAMELLKDILDKFKEA